MKTKKIVAKRFKVTAKKKLFHRSQGSRHLRRKKGKSRQRRQNKSWRVAGGRFTNVIRHFLPGVA